MVQYIIYLLLLLLLLILLLTATEQSFGGSSPYTSTHKTKHSKHKYTYYQNIRILQYTTKCNWDSVVGKRTHYSPDGPGFKPVGDKNFPIVHVGTEAHPASCTMGTVSLSWG
jgi:hypothetical protein